MISNRHIAYGQWICARVKTGIIFYTNITAFKIQCAKDSVHEMSSV